MRAITMVWGAIPIPTKLISAETPAPVTVPSDQNAWNHGMMLRLTAFSTEAPSTFIATSAIPFPAPAMMMATTVSA